MSTKVLLVEGVADKNFFEAYCTSIGLSGIKIHPPKEINPGTGNGWSNLLSNLNDVLKQLSDVSLTHLAIIVDADYPPHNVGGFTQRLEKIKSTLADWGYEYQSSPDGGGFLFHNNGLKPIGLWIMPNHKDDGMLEDFIAGLIADTKQLELLQFADNTLTILPHTLFNKDLHRTKAKVATWRAWQKTPGASLDKALKDGLLDTTQAAQFKNWLEKVFI